MKKTLLLFIVVIMIILFPLFYGCDFDTKHEVIIRTNDYHCYVCEYEWTGNSLNMICPRCESPRIEILK